MQGKKEIGERDHFSAIKYQNLDYFKGQGEFNCFIENDTGMGFLNIMPSHRTFFVIEFGSPNNLMIKK